VQRRLFGPPRKIRSDCWIKQRASRAKHQSLVQEFQKNADEHLRSKRQKNFWKVPQFILSTRELIWSCEITIFSAKRISIFKPHDTGIIRHLKVLSNNYEVMSLFSQIDTSLLFSRISQNLIVLDAMQMGEIKQTQSRNVLHIVAQKITDIDQMPSEIDDQVQELASMAMSMRILFYNARKSKWLKNMLLSFTCVREKDDMITKRSLSWSARKSTNLFSITHMLN